MIDLVTHFGVRVTQSSIRDIHPSKRVTREGKWVTRSNDFNYSLFALSSRLLSNLKGPELSIFV
ncbi:hypothetical protein KGI01_23120 [Kurthia gibsonii]|nr:hypothetical protein KGI01_23120 [Kurthia gibsonii]